MRSLARLNAVLLAIVILIAVSSWFWLRQRMDDLNARVEDAQVQLADRQIQLERAEEELRSLQELFEDCGIGDNPQPGVKAR